MDLKTGVLDTATPDVPLTGTSSDWSTREGTYLPTVDGLRALSICIVLAGHFGLGSVVPAAFGVTIFFLISGFLITRLLLSEVEATGTILFSGFYARRFTRLAPALLVFIAVSSSVYSYFGGKTDWLQVGAAILYFTNYYDAFVMEHFGPAYNSNGSFFVLWSLAVEEHFYLLFPFIIAWLFKRQALLSAMLMLAVVILVWRIIARTCLSVSDEYLHIATDCRIDSILYGCIIAYVYQSASSFSRLKHWLESNLAFCIGVIILLSTFIIRNALFRETLRYTLQGVALTPIFCGLVFAPLGSFAVHMRRILTNGSVLFLGKISYSLYLWHYAGVELAKHLVPGTEILVRLPLLILFAMLTSVLSYFCVERPFLGLRRRLGSHAR